MGRLDLEIIPDALEKLSSNYVILGGSVLRKMNELRKKLEPEGYVVGIPAERYRGVPKRITISHSQKTYAEICRRFDELDKQIE